MNYYCRLRTDGNSVSVEFPDIQGVYTYGDDINHALAMAKEALESVLLCKLDCGGDIPFPVDRSDSECKPIEIDENIAKRILKRKMIEIQKELNKLEKKESVLFVN